MKESIKINVSGILNVSVKTDKLSDIAIGVQRITDKSIIQRVERIINSARVTALEVLTDEDGERYLCIGYSHPLNVTPCLYPVIDYTEDFLSLHIE